MDSMNWGYFIRWNLFSFHFNCKHADQWPNVRRAPKTNRRTILIYDYEGRELSSFTKISSSMRTIFRFIFRPAPLLLNMTWFLHFSNQTVILNVFDFAFFSCLDFCFHFCSPLSQNQSSTWSNSKINSEVSSYFSHQ